MDKKTLGTTLLHIVCCGLIIAALVGGWALFAKNWWILIGAGILILIAVVLMKGKQIRTR